MIIQDILNIQRIKGLRKAELDAYDWFISAKKDVKNTEVSFCQNGLLQVGKINVFTYNPLHKSTLDYYDKNPVVISLGTFIKNKKVYELGINLNFIPVPYKWFILEKIQQIFMYFFESQKNKTQNKVSAYNQPQIKYKYTVLKELLSSYGFGFAIRVYVPSRKTDIYCINYNNWTDCAFLSIEDFEGITYSEMLSEFNKYKNIK